MTYTGLSMEESYPSAKKQLEYYTAPTDWAISWFRLNVHYYKIHFVV